MKDIFYTSIFLFGLTILIGVMAYFFADRRGIHRYRIPWKLPLLMTLGVLFGLFSHPRPPASHFPKLLLFVVAINLGLMIGHNCTVWSLHCVQRRQWKKRKTVH